MKMHFQYNGKWIFHSKHTIPINNAPYPKGIYKLIKYWLTHSDLHEKERAHTHTHPGTGQKKEIILLPRMKNIVH